MIFNIEIDDVVFQSALKNALVSQINNRASGLATEILKKNENVLDEAVRKYIDSHLTGEKLKSFIDKSVIEILAERIKDMY